MKNFKDHILDNLYDFKNKIPNLSEEESSYIDKYILELVSNLQKIDEKITPEKIKKISESIDQIVKENTDG